MSANAEYQQQNEVPADNDYASRTGQSTIPVLKDDAPLEPSIDRATADSDQQLGKLYPCSTIPFYVLTIQERDDKEAIDKGNIIEGRTRGATKQAGTYAEPGDEEGLPGPEDGTSALRK